MKRRLSDESDTGYTPNTPIKTAAEEYGYLTPPPSFSKRSAVPIKERVGQPTLDAFLGLREKPHRTTNHSTTHFNDNSLTCSGCSFVSDDVYVIQECCACNRQVCEVCSVRRGAVQCLDCC